MKRRILALLLCLLVLTGCSGSGDLMKGITPAAGDVAEVELTGSGSEAAATFAVNLLRQAAGEGENTLISPLSILCALAMTANGAEGETLAQMEETLGMPVEEWNRYLGAYLQSAAESTRSKFHIANAIWFTDDERVTVKQDFLQANADWYGAGIYRAPFNQKTCDDINRWVRDNTDGMVEDILDEIRADSVMYLVNALAFDSQWEEEYEERQVRTDAFYPLYPSAEGKREVEMMHSEEALYLEDENAAGFLKLYKGGRYAFAALLPQSDIPLSDYVAGLTGERLHTILGNRRQATVEVAMPKFDSSSSVDLAQALSQLGMPDAFDQDLADFSGLGSSSAGSIYISRVLHKTYITVDEQGTRAAAATVVEMNDSGDEPGEVKQVILDRPFLYMIVDLKADLPIFIGTMSDPGQ